MLKNGLRVLHHKDESRTTATLNILYNVGARDENPDKTGFAHLFEHLMFGGSVNIPHYDKEVERSGGANNAYTNNEFTNYYLTIPMENIETGCWLESDRMLQLDFSEKSLEVQRGVVIEEFRQRCFNAPFGMLWHHLRGLLYQKSPYRWPTIGLTVEHIEQASLDDVRDFYNRFYNPANAILSVVGNLDLEAARDMTEKWFGSIEKSGTPNANHYFAEPPQEERRMLETSDLCPNNAVVLAWKGPGYLDPQSLELELFADMLGGTEASPLHVELVKRSGKFNSAASFYMRGVNEGMFVIYGILNEGVSHDEASGLLQQFLDNASHGDLLSQEHLEMKVNKAITSLLFAKTSPANIAEKLCFFENLGDASLVNNEEQELRAADLHGIKQTAATTLRPKNMSVIHYSPKANAQ